MRIQWLNHMQWANPERYCGLFWIHCSLKKFKRITWEAMDLCFQVLKESSKSRFDSYSVKNSVLIISHITFRDCRVHIFSDILSRNSCMLLHHWTSLQPTATVMLFTERRKASALCFYNDCTTFNYLYLSHSYRLRTVSLFLQNNWEQCTRVGAAKPRDSHAFSHARGHLRVSSVLLDRLSRRKRGCS